MLSVSGSREPIYLASDGEGPSGVPDVGGCCGGGEAGADGRTRGVEEGRGAAVELGAHLVLEA